MQVEKPRVVQARPEHGARIDELEAVAFAFDPAGRRRVEQVRENEPAIVLVATIGARDVCGTVTASTFWHGRSLNVWILALAVDPRFRRRGVARRLLRALLRCGRALGATRFRLRVPVEDRAAIDLYEACGFARLLTVEDAGAPGRRSHLMVRRSHERRRRPPP